jgi:outer membrane protein
MRLTSTRFGAKQLLYDLSTKGTVPMKAFTVVAALSFALLTVPALAQQKPPQKPPATPPAAPVQKPAAPAPAPAQALPPRPFPEGAKIAYFNPQAVVNDSKEGKAGTAQLKALQEQKVKEIQDKQKQVETDNTLINSPAMADDKRAALQKEIDRLGVDIQRMQQDAQQELQEKQTELQNLFQRRLYPIVEQIATEKNLQMILIADPQTIYWVDRGLDLSAEITRRMDATSTTKTPLPEPSAKQ